MRGEREGEEVERGGVRQRRWRSEGCKSVDRKGSEGMGGGGGDWGGLRL